jgi:DNA-binding MarR family transcriptional regulator
MARGIARRPRAEKASVAGADMAPTAFEDLAAVRLYRIGELIARITTLAVEEPFRVRITDLRILSVLQADDALPMAEISRRARVDKAWISRLVREMEEKGLLSRRPDPHDERARLVCLTDAGRRLQADLIPRARERELQLLADLDREAVTAALARIEQNALDLLKTLDAAAD